MPRATGVERDARLEERAVIRAHRGTIDERLVVDLIRDVNAFESEDVGKVLNRGYRFRAKHGAHGHGEERQRRIGRV